MKGQLQLVGDRADAVDHLVWSEVAEGQLLMSSWRQRRLYVRLELEVDVVADRECTLGAALVSLHLHPLLGSVEVLPDRRQHSSTCRD
jgi:hypothetical protein